MAHESFEDPDVAAVMNRLFVNVKVDREERPDVDSIYMDAVQALTGQRRLADDGLPGARRPPLLRRHVLPEGRPPRACPGSSASSTRSTDVWRENRTDDVLEQADKLRDTIGRMLDLGSAGGAAGRDGDGAASRRPRSSTGRWRTSRAQFDAPLGGFGRAPKFPPSMTLDFLLRSYVRDADPHTLEMVTTTLDAMAAGGMYDHVGGGFDRYSTDDYWLVPHFEKMLYDQALLVGAYLRG